MVCRSRLQRRRQHRPGGGAADRAAADRQIPEERETRRERGAADATAATAAAVAGLAREVEGLRRAVDELAGLPRRMDELAGLFARLSAATAAKGAVAAAGTPSWLDLPSAGGDVVAVLKDLLGWLETIYLRYADAAQSLPECWLWHPDVIEELLWLRHAWQHAYEDEDAPPHLPGDWHDRQRPGVVRRIKATAGTCSLDNHLPGGARHHGAPVVPLAEAYEQIAALVDPPPRRTGTHPGRGTARIHTGPASSTEGRLMTNTHPDVTTGGHVRPRTSRPVTYQDRRQQVTVDQIGTGAAGMSGWLSGHQPQLLLAAGVFAVALSGYLVWLAVRHDRVPDAATWLAVVIATAFSAEGMWEVARHGLDLTAWQSVGLFAVAEAAMTSEAIRARRHQHAHGHPGAHGTAVWVIAAGAGLVSAFNAATTGLVVGVPVRLAIPLLAAWLWWLELTSDGTAKRPDAISWRLTPRRILVRLGLAEPGAAGRDRDQPSPTHHGPDHHRAPAAPRLTPAEEPAHRQAAPAGTGRRRRDARRSPHQGRPAAPHRGTPGTPRRQPRTAPSGAGQHNRTGHRNQTPVRTARQHGGHLVQAGQQPPGRQPPGRQPTRTAGRHHPDSEPDKWPDRGTDTKPRPWGGHSRGRAAASRRAPGHDPGRDRPPGRRVRPDSPPAPGHRHERTPPHQRRGAQLMRSPIARGAPSSATPSTPGARAPFAACRGGRRPPWPASPAASVWTLGTCRVLVLARPASRTGSPHTWSAAMSRIGWPASVPAPVESRIRSIRAHRNQAPQPKPSPPQPIQPLPPDSDPTKNNPILRTSAAPQKQPEQRYTPMHHDPMVGSGPASRPGTRTPGGLSC